MIKTKFSFPYDYCANIVIKGLLKKRNAKEIYSSAELTEKTLSALTPEIQDSYIVPDYIRFKNKVEILTLGGFPLLKITPANAEPSEKAVIYLHGGAFVNQPDDRHYRVVDDLVKYSGATLYFFIYPKAPSHDYKETYSLVEELYADLIEKHGAKNIIFMGDSAGATMSVCLCEVFRNKGIEQPGKLILFSLVADTKLSHPDIEKIYPKDPMQGVDGLKLYVKAWAGNEDVYSPVLNPMATDVSQLPKTVIFGGTYEIFNPEVKEFVKLCEQKGADVSFFQYFGMYHCFVLFDLLAARWVKQKAGKLIKE